MESLIAQLAHSGSNIYFLGIVDPRMDPGSISISFIYTPGGMDPPRTRNPFHFQHFNSSFHFAFHFLSLSLSADCPVLSPHLYIFINKQEDNQTLLLIFILSVFLPPFLFISSFLLTKRCSIRYRSLRHHHLIYLLNPKSSFSVPSPSRPISRRRHYTNTRHTDTITLEPNRLDRNDSTQSLTGLPSKN